MRITLTLLILSVVCAGTASAQPFAYVTNCDSNNVDVINVSTNKLIRTIDTVDVGAACPYGVAVTPDGKFVYVANAGSFLTEPPHKVSVIRTSDNMVVATVDVGLNPLGVAVTPDGRFVYVTNGGQNIISPFYTVSVIERSDDPVNDKVVATVPVRAIPDGVAVTPDGKFVYVANSGSDDVSVIRTSDNTVVATVDVRHEPVFLAITPDGKFIYVTNFGDNTVSVIERSDDPVNDKVVATVDVEDLPAGVAVTPDGKFVYVANLGTLHVSVISTSDNSLFGTVNVEDFPEGVAASPDNKFVYVRDNVRAAPFGTRGHVSVINNLGEHIKIVVATVILNGEGRGLVAITPFPRGEGNGSGAGGGGCGSLAPSTGSNASLTMYLLIPAFILIARLWRRRTAQKHT